MSDSGAPAYVDPVDGSTYSIDVPRWRSNAGRPLMITPLPGIGRRGINKSDRSLWRYSGAFPVCVSDPISLGEGCTPLVSRRFRDVVALFKLEWFAPSGSFKDRGAAVMLSILRQQGVDAVLEDSSGNGGAAVSTYAAAAGMRARILVPASTSPAKLVQMQVCGAEVELISGSRQATADAAVARSSELFYASHNWQAYFLQGTKTLAYELWEDLGFRAPDHVIIPCGAGSNILGCDIGFGELLRRGEIDRLPRLHAIQPAHCAPLHAGFAAGADDYCDVEPQPTLAEGASIARPVRGREVLAALRRSRGSALAISEADIHAALIDLARVGFYVEPTCAMAAAALSELHGRGTIQAGEIAVVVLTGTGIKTTPRITELMGV